MNPVSSRNAAYPLLLLLAVLSAAQCGFLLWSLRQANAPHSVAARNTIATTKSSATGKAVAKPGAKSPVKSADGATDNRTANPMLVWIIAGGTALSLLLLAGLASSLRTRGDAPAPTATHDTVENNPILQKAMIGIATLDSDGYIVNCNRTLHQIFAFQGLELRGRALNSMVHPDDMNRDRGLYLELVGGERQDYQVEQRYFRQSGDMMWARLTVVRNAAGPGFANAALVDITRRKTAEDELAVTREAIHNLYQVVVAPDLELHEKMQALLAMGCRRFNVETGIVGRVDGGQFEVLQVLSPDEKIRRGKVYPVEGAGATGAASGDSGMPRAPVGVERTSFVRDWRHHPFFSVTENETYLGAPIIVQGELFGTVGFSSSDGRAAPFDGAETEFVQLMAQWLGSEIERLEARAALETKQTELLDANAKLEALATHDALTGVKNRRAFDERLEMEFNRARRYQTPLSILLLDVDRFKQYNDSFGHPAGDQVLRTIGKLLQDSVRNIDFVARYGGEEFVVLLPNTDEAGSMILAERLRAKIENASWKERAVTASFGAASLSTDHKERTEITAAADLALYYSKSHGRNRVSHIHEVQSPDAAAKSEATAQ